MIHLSHVTKRYGDLTVVDDLNLTVADGEMLVLLGGSGSGKTTTLRMINRLTDPTSGEVFVDGQDVTTFKAHRLRRHIGYVFQQVGLFPHMTLAENIAVTPRLLRWDPQRTDQRVDELLHKVELPPEEHRHRFPHQLSGGQRQRVGVARALAAAPRVVLLDEPFGALDPLTRHRIRRFFHRLHNQLRFTAIFVTHDVTEALQLADRIAVMRNGAIVQNGSPAELLRTPADDYVADLMDTPRSQADFLARLMADRRS